MMYDISPFFGPNPLKSYYCKVRMDFPKTLSTCLPFQISHFSVHEMVSLVGTIPTT